MGKKQVERGQDGEGLLTASCRACGLWNHKMENMGFGTPFDKVIIPPGGGYAVEVKTREEPKIAFSSIEPNERKGLNRFCRMVGKKNAYILGIWLSEDFGKRAFLIPWWAVKDEICSGVRGSIYMLNWPELRRKGEGWDLTELWKKR